MSFSSDIKDEIVKIQLKNDLERSAVLCALTHTSAALRISGRTFFAEYISENKNITRLIKDIAAKLYKIEATVSKFEQEGIKSQNSIVTLMGPQITTLLEDMGYLPRENDDNFIIGHIPDHLASQDEIIPCFLRGAFLGGGSVSDPTKGYHLEIVCRQEKFASELCNILNQLSLNARVSNRKSGYIVYIKEGEKVADFLTLIGAINGMMAFENVRVMRDVTNGLNRRANFENANMQKAAMAAAQQLVDIETIIKLAGLETLSPKLKEMAEVRINNPEATLNELSSIMGIGKSGINHRLAKIAEIADELRMHN